MLYAVGCFKKQAILCESSSCSKRLIHLFGPWDSGASRLVMTFIDQRGSVILNPIAVGSIPPK